MQTIVAPINERPFFGCFLKGTGVSKAMGPTKCNAAVRHFDLQGYIKTISGLLDHNGSDGWQWFWGV